jgi:hypothetical protein
MLAWGAVNNDIHGLLASVNEGTTSAFLWEWYTTKPWADKGECRFIGSVPTPWPSWLIAAHPSRAKPEQLGDFLGSLTRYVRAFDSEESRKNENVGYIRDIWGYPEEDVKVVFDCFDYERGIHLATNRRHGCKKSSTPRTVHRSPRRSY